MFSLTFYLRSFGYSGSLLYVGCFAGYGIKLQALTLLNGMIGSLYLGSWRTNDSGLLNMSGLDAHLSDIFRELRMELPPGAGNQFPAVYGDGIFPWLSTVVARYCTIDGSELVINAILVSV